jgi:ribosomal-protein-alanine N-acetyltransferase
MKLVLRYMELADIPQVAYIDRTAFDLPWSERSYAYEITEANYSHLVSLELTDERPSQGWRRWLGLNGSRKERRIVGYGGLWNIGREAHISTIAVHPDYRGRGWGEILLAGMVKRAITLRAELVVLEVRVSNTRAQNLYYKYEFRIADVKPQYYRNNDEDAYGMCLNLTDEDIHARFEERFAAIRARQPFTDLYSSVQPPHHPDEAWM